MKTGAREEHALARTIWRRLRPLNRFVIRRIRQGWGPRRTVLLLTTTGRRSGLPRVTPLQFEEQDGLYYVAAGRGMQADWVRNLTADPAVLVEVKGNQFPATAELESHPQRIAEFLTLRLRRHPIMVRAIMMAEGLPLRYSPQDLVDFASQKAMVVLRPVGIEAHQDTIAPQRRAGAAAIALGVFATLAGAGFVYRLLARPWHRRWGASAAEASDALPGDSLVTEATLSSTRAITIAAPPKQVWAWLVQIGQGRGGFYSYDRLENLAGLNIHSANMLNPKLQQLAAGDAIAVEPGGSGYVVDTVVPERLLLLYLDGNSPGDMGAHFRAADAASTWAFVLRPQPDAGTRLVVRWRARYPGAKSTSRAAGLIRLFLEAIEFVMERKMLLGIRQRAEQTKI